MIIDVTWDEGNKVIIIIIIVNIIAATNLKHRLLEHQRISGFSNTKYWLNNSKIKMYLH